MMTCRTVLCGVLFGAMALAITAAAEDYTSKSTEELARIRTSIHGASKEDQDSFYKEWDSRLRGMSDDQRRYFTGSDQYDDSRGRGRDSRGGETELRGREDEIRGREVELRGRAQEGEGVSSGSGDHRGGSGSSHDGMSGSSGSSGSSGKGGSGSGSSGKGGGKKGGK